MEGRMLCGDKRKKGLAIVLAQPEKFRWSQRVSSPGKVRYFLDIIILHSHPMFSKMRTDATYHLVCPLDTFSEQLDVGGETHQTFIATYIRVNCIKVLYVGFSCIWKNLLKLLYLQLRGQFQQYAVDELVACQLILGANPDAAEHLIMDVTIQSIHQFRGWQSCIHL